MSHTIKGSLSLDPIEFRGLSNLQGRFLHRHVRTQPSNREILVPIFSIAALDDETMENGILRLSEFKVTDDVGECFRC